MNSGSLQEEEIRTVGQIQENLPPGLMAHRVPDRSSSNVYFDRTAVLI